MSEKHATISFKLPEKLIGTKPPELRGLSRSEVKLLVINRDNGEIKHSTFDNLKSFLKKGDLLVLNSSRTIPASLLGRDLKSGKSVELRLAEHLPCGSWLVLLLGNGIDFNGMWIDFGLGLSCSVLSRDDRIPALWKVRFSISGPELTNLIYKLGRPVTYEYIEQPLSIDYYQNVYALEPGSSEMPSAGRAFTWKMLFDLKRAGIETTNIALHAGLSSYMNDETDAKHPILEEAFFIAPNVASKINETRARGKRVIAVGTTVVRTLESASGADGTVTDGHGYTSLRIARDYKLKVVNGLLTGLHEPEASHLDLLQAFLPSDTLNQAYEEAIRLGYLWHEFGDLNLIA